MKPVCFMSLLLGAAMAGPPGNCTGNAKVDTWRFLCATKRVSGFHGIM